MEISNTDQALAHLIYAKDCISSGHLAKSKESINSAISLIEKQNPDEIDDEVLRLLIGDNDES